MGLLDGKVAVITGAGNGIGRAEALLFAKEGAKVVVNDVGCEVDGTGGDPAVAERVAHEIRAAGGEAVAHHGSVATVEGARDAIAMAVRTFGKLDVLVNNAGILRDKSFYKLEETAFDAVIAVQLRGTFLVAQAAAKRFAEQKRGGCIVNTTALAGILGNHSQAALSAASAGVLGLTRTMAIELKKHEVRVNALAPVARTRSTEGQSLFAAMPDEHFGPHFVAPVALFLCSDLSAGLTGEIVSVAGNKVSVYTTQESLGALKDDPKTPWTPAELRARWDELSRP